MRHSGAGRDPESASAVHSWIPDPCLRRNDGHSGLNLGPFTSLIGFLPTQPVLSPLLRSPRRVSLWQCPMGLKPENKSPP